MVDFICMGLIHVDLCGTRTENYKMKNSCKQWVSNPGTFAYEESSLGVELLVEISNEHINVDRVLPEFGIKIYLCRFPRVR